MKHLAVALALLLAPPANGQAAQDSDKGVDCARKTLHAATPKQETVWEAAELIVGENEYEKGDYVKAGHHFRIAAEENNAWSPIAQFYLGVMYSMGQGVPQDETEAVRWYCKAAEQGNADAQYNLGVMYRNGEGLPQDYTAAVQWLRRAAEQGLPVAQNNLGSMYGRGEGVTRDHVQAHMWLNLAAAQGDEYGRVNRDHVARQMTRAEIAEARRLAREWSEKRKVL